MDSHERSVPGVSDLARDAGRNTVGEIMGRVGGLVQMRPLGGGREWDAQPGDVRPLTPAEALGARNQARNRLTVTAAFVKSGS
ncbi:hypothetical protein ACFC09_33890 [Streptomyces sp. NPDC056161]|uniref:hypothetical protein n=1 Tax=Streptomyces sp. NPDC056161 TaxID=3345732 RepID=UPI0035D77DA3